MTDIMVDTETTGVIPHLAGMIQLSAIKFNYNTEEVGPSFDACLSLLPFRRWDDGTREFWQGKNRQVYSEIVARMEHPTDVLNRFFHWVNADAPPETGYRMWAKPITFDYPILASHMEAVGLPMPFHYRYSRDLNTYLAAIAGTVEHSSVEDQVPFPANGKLHNALHDAAWQLDQLFYAKRTSLLAP